MTRCPILERLPRGADRSDPLPDQPSTATAPPDARTELLDRRRDPRRAPVGGGQRIGWRPSCSRPRCAGADGIGLRRRPVQPARIPAAERDLRLGVERSYRELARWAASRAERIQLVDRANQFDPGRGHEQQPSDLPFLRGASSRGSVLRAMRRPARRRARLSDAALGSSSTRRFCRLCGARAPR